MCLARIRYGAGPPVCAVRRRCIGVSKLLPTYLPWSLNSTSQASPSNFKFQFLSIRLSCPIRVAKHVITFLMTTQRGVLGFGEEKASGTSLLIIVMAWVFKQARSLKLRSRPIFKVFQHSDRHSDSIISPVNRTPESPLRGPGRGTGPPSIPHPWPRQTKLLLPNHFLDSSSSHFTGEDLQPLQ